MTQRILIAGIGNIFLGDDAFGCEVARQLSQRTWPEGVHVVDFGIRGIDVAYALLHGHDLTILVDAVPRGGLPGDVYLIEIDSNDTRGPLAQGPLIDGHAMTPQKVMELVGALGGSACGRILLVGCEPASFGSEEEGMMGLSIPVAAAVDKAMAVIESLVLDALEPISVNS